DAHDYEIGARRAAVKKRSLLHGERAFGLPRQTYGKPRAIAGLALDHDPAARRLDDLPRDPEAEPETAEIARRHRPFEALEDALLLLRIDANAVVGDLENRLATVGAQLDLDGLAGAIFDRVGQKVRDHLLQAQPIPHPRHVRRHARHDLAASAGRGFGEPLDHIAHQI